MTGAPDSPHAPAPDLALLGWAEGHVGAFRWEWCGWDHAESSVWRLRADGGVRYLKTFPGPRKFELERRALELWAPRVPRAPELLASDTDMRALLMGAVEGRDVHALDLDPTSEITLHFAAGQWLRGMHNLEFEDPDPMPLGDALGARASNWLVRAGGLVADADLHRVSAEAVGLAAVGQAPRVPCHRDYSPRNWVWDESGIGVIDFEHARPDWWLVDMDRLEGRWWVGRPELRSSFFAGYGRTPSAEESAAARALGLVNALATIVWAVEHRDRNFEAEGRARLARALS